MYFLFPLRLIPSVTIHAAILITEDKRRKEWPSHVRMTHAMYFNSFFRDKRKLVPQRQTIITLPKPGKDPKFPQNLRSISLLSTTGKLFKKVIQKILQRHLDSNNLLNASHFGFRASHSTTLQGMRLTDHINLNFNNNMSTAAVFLDIEKAFHTTWHLGLLRKLSKLKVPVNLIRIIESHLSNRKFKVSVEDELSTPREIQAGVPQGSVLAPTLYSLYINDTPQTSGVHLALFADDTCTYAADRKESYVLRKLQRGLNAMEAWCERWNIKIKKDKTRAVYFSRRLRLVEAYLTLKGLNIPFVKDVRYLGVIFDRKITWRPHTDLVVTKALRTFVQIYILMKSERLSIKSKMTLYKALIRLKMTYACPAWEPTAETHFMKMQRLQNKILRVLGGFPRSTPNHHMHMALQIPYIYDFITKTCRKQAEVIRNHDNANVCNIGKGEAHHLKHKRLKFGGGQAYYRSDV
jgi:hypothetical protein